MGARKEQDLPLLWDISLAFLYDQLFVDSLAGLLKQLGVSKILDCSCGTGFPALALKQLGFDVWATDGSAAMVDKMREKMRAEGVEVPQRVLQWEDLSGLNQTFDVVLCRGNSFIYVDSWDDGSKLDTKEFLARGQRALEAMYGTLRTGGHLYIDMPSRREYESGDEVFEDLGRRTVDGKAMSMSWLVKHDWVKRVRSVRSTRTVDGQIYEHDYYSFLLKHEEMKALLERAGFVGVQEIKLDGENSYCVFLASR